MNAARMLPAELWFNRRRYLWKTRRNQGGAKVVTITIIIIAAEVLREHHWQS